MVRWPVVGIAGLLASGVVLGAASWINDRELAGRRQEIERETRLVARMFATRIEGGLVRHITALQQMANFFASSRKVTEKEFHSFAATTMRQNPSCLNIAFVDPTSHVKMVYPSGDRRLMVGLDIRAHTVGYEAVLRARRSRKPIVSPPLQLIPGRPGFELAVPVFMGQAYLGVLVGACRSEDYFGSMLFPEMSARYEHRILNSGEPMIASAGFDPVDRSLPTVAQLFTQGGAEWEVQLRPQADLVRARLGSDRATYWTMACLLCLTTSFLVCAGTFWATGVRAKLESSRVALSEAKDRLVGTREQLAQAEKMTALGELVAGVAHEMNNPLAGIVGFTQLLMLEKVPERVRRRLSTIAAEAERMTKIVRNLLTFARKHTPERALLGLNGIIEKTLELTAYQLLVSQVRVVKDFDPALPLTMLDFHQIQQVLINLLSNAQQAMAEAGRGGTIRLTTRHVDGRIELRVSDDGPGIPEEIHKRIFEPLFTTKKEGRGTGLGLSLCYGIIQEHEGSIRVDSRPGEGATFVVSFPIVRGPEGRAQPLAAPTEVHTPPLRILAVDDEPAVLDFLVELLTRRGHKVDTASDVPEALRKIDAGRLDLIITDMKMPTGSGRDVHKAAVAKSRTLGKRVVFTSGNPSGDDTQRFFRETGSPFLPKPFTIQEVDQAIVAALRN